MSNTKEKIRARSLEKKYANVESLNMSDQMTEEKMKSSVSTEARRR